MDKKIGKISDKVIKVLNLDMQLNTPIFINEGNIEHIKSKHYDDYNKYINQITNILENPTFVARHPKNDSIEYIKRYILNNEYVLVAVRVTKQNVNFVRTMFVMSKKKVKIYKERGYFKKVN